MKTAFTLLLLALAAVAAATAQADKDVLSAVNTWKQAMLKGDAATLDKLYHKDLVYTHSTAKVEMKAECIHNATKPDGISKGIEIHDLTAHIYGNTAIVKGKFDMISAAGVMNHLDVLMVWIKSPQGWQLLARQATKIP